MEKETESKKLRFSWRKIVLGTILVLLVPLLALILSVISLRWVNPPVTAFTLQENWSELDAERYNLRDWWVPAQQLPEHLKLAVIASEDQLFNEHSGFDFDSISEALEDRRNNVRARGASTISQQVAKNLYLWPGQSFFRKGLEAGITVLIEFFWSKERILEVYLNVAEFGPGFFGIGKASDAILGLHPSSLEPEFSARFAAVLPSPKRMRVDPPSPYALERSQWILRQMTQLSGHPYLPGTTYDKVDDPDPYQWIDDQLTAEDDTLKTMYPDGELRDLDLPDSLLLKIDNDSLWMPINELPNP